MKNNDIQRVILDFDGTCTQIPKAFELYLEEYRKIFASEVTPVDEEEWRNAAKEVRQHCPEAGWTVSGTPSAPADSDPYILAFEITQHLVRARKITKAIPADIHPRAYQAAPAPWRDDAEDLFTSLMQRNIMVCIVSNSSTSVIEGRLDELLGAGNEVRTRVLVKGGAAKFRIQETSWDNSEMSSEMRQVFDALPADGRTSEGMSLLKRPIYLRRSAYFETIARFVGNDVNALRSTLFCGDIWELDLAMPATIGLRVHLIERAAPFFTYEYELNALNQLGCSGRRSVNLLDVIRWFE